MRSLWQTFYVCVFAFLGGIVSEQLLHPHNSIAQTPPQVTKDDVMGSVHEIFDTSGQRRIDLSAARSPMQNFYGANSMVRLQLGIYPGEEGPVGDAGLPEITFSDRAGRVRMLLRLAQGNNQAPILVMKDTKGKDRVLLGTSFADEDEDAFLVYFDKYGVKHNVFGKF